MNDAMTLLRRDFLIPELEDVMREAGVEGTVAVQARQTITETEWLLDIAEHHPFILGVVGWVPLAELGAGRILDRLVLHSRLKAVRHVLHDEPDDFYMLNDDFNRGIDLLQSYGLAYDILIFERHLPQTVAFVDRHLGQVFVIDHIGKPRIRDGVMSPWREHMEDLAKRENVYCKVSGMMTEADWNRWTPDLLRPYFDVVLSAFGPKRLMFGSDWPVLTLAGTYKTWMNTFRSFVCELSPDEQESLCRSTAIAAYRL
jgi:L-fuconolactonase